MSAVNWYNQGDTVKVFHEEYPLRQYEGLSLHSLPG